MLAMHPPSDLALCSIVVMELYGGALRSARPTLKQAEVARFVGRFVSLPFDNTAAEIAASVGAGLARAGMPIGSFDLLIAAIALANDLTLVTHNTREFSRVAGL